MLGQRGLQIVERFQKGVLLGNGFLPIRTEGGGLNEEFLQQVEEVIDRKEPIMIFPTEPSDDLNPDVERIRRGAAVVAIKYDLPIVPLYVGGAHTWRAGERIGLSFGEPIEPHAKSVNDMTALVGQKIFELKN
jgi:1-acyl-sn-glycerol-3-phosphate acyltransferase